MSEDNRWDYVKEEDKKEWEQMKDDEDALIHHLPDDEDDEVWKKIPGFSGYEASDKGRIRSYHARNGKPWHISETPQRVLQQYTSGYYPFVHIMDDEGQGRTKRVAALVMLAFVGPRLKGTVVCHADGDPSNNVVENLRYDTRKNNARDAMLNGRYSLSPEQVLDIREQRVSGRSAAEIAKHYGIGIYTVHKVCSGAVYRHIGGPITKSYQGKLPRETVTKILKAVKNGATQKSQAEMYDVSPSYISRVVNGSRRRRKDENDVS